MRAFTPNRSKSYPPNIIVPPQPPPEDQSDFWRERLAAACRDYENARLEASRAVEEITCESTSQDIDALTAAHRKEAAALDEYMRVLRIFHQLVVRGEKPGT
jgi:hypothetical protein